MIRSVKLTCSVCGKDFVPQENVLYYKDTFINSNIRDAAFICPDCINEWHEKWQIKNAVFTEVDYIMTVDIELEDGSVYKNVDCTPMEDTVVTGGMDIPHEAQRKLYEIYFEWDNERKRNTLKDCTFNDAFMQTTFSCETYGGEKYTDVAFRFNMKGVLETAVPVPEYISKQIVEAYRIYEMLN